MYTVTEAVPACRSLVGAILALPAILVTTACGSSAPPEPRERGALEVTTETRGQRVDPDGYAIVVDDGTPRAIGVSARVTFEGLEANLIGVELTGQSSNCSVDGDNPRVISIEEGETARTTFELVCGEVSSAALLFDGSSYAIAGDAAAFDHERSNATLSQGTENRQGAYVIILECCGNRAYLHQAVDLGDIVRTIGRFDDQGGSADSRNKLFRKLPLPCDHDTQGVIAIDFAYR